ncbi:MAG: 16S rRNA (guanine(527)-N(7))-methyltransferase RsmG [Pseudomonadota bacterium]
MTALKNDQEALLAVKDVSRETLERLGIYAKLLRQWQARINLVSSHTLDDLWHRHIVDSAQAFRVKPEFVSWLDIGSGAGFPGLVVALLRAENVTPAQITLVESVGKKCMFMRTVIRETGLSSTSVSVQVLNGRIEEHVPTMSRVDVVSARALASLQDLFTMTEASLTDGATGLFFKGERSAEEIAEASKTWRFSCRHHASVVHAGSTLLEISNLTRR